MDKSWRGQLCHNIPILKILLSIRMLRWKLIYFIYKISMFIALLDAGLLLHQGVYGRAPFKVDSLDSSHVEVCKIFLLWLIDLMSHRDVANWIFILQHAIWDFLVEFFLQKFEILWTVWNNLHLLKFYLNFLEFDGEIFFFEFLEIQMELLLVGWL